MTSLHNREYQTRPNDIPVGIHVVEITSQNITVKSAAIDTRAKHIKYGIETRLEEFSAKQEGTILQTT